MRCRGRRLYSSFLSTPSARRATKMGLDWGTNVKFLSTPSARRATLVVVDDEAIIHNFYPRPPRGGRRQLQRGRAERREISIHALREEGDRGLQQCFKQPIVFLSTPSARRATIQDTPQRILYKYFYPRPPRGGRPVRKRSKTENSKFLSTPSARRATHKSTL